MGNEESADIRKSFYRGRIMEQFIISLVTVLLGSGLIQFFFTRHDTKEKEKLENKLTPIADKLDKIINEQKKSEKDALRTQLLVMMTVLPNNHEEIMTLAERYFKELKGDWFYSSLFKKWLKDNDIENPVWFEK